MSQLPTDVFAVVISFLPYFVDRRRVININSNTRTELLSGWPDPVTYPYTDMYFVNDPLDMEKARRCPFKLQIALNADLLVKNNIEYLAGLDILMVYNFRPKESHRFKELRNIPSLKYIAVDQSFEGVTTLDFEINKNISYVYRNMHTYLGKNGVLWATLGEEDPSTTGSRTVLPVDCIRFLVSVNKATIKEIHIDCAPMCTDTITELPIKDLKVIEKVIFYNSRLVIPDKQKRQGGGSHPRCMAPISPTLTELVGVSLGFQKCNLVNLRRLAYIGPRTRIYKCRGILDMLCDVCKTHRNIIEYLPDRYQ